jgi:hypothetical protein
VQSPPKIVGPLGPCSETIHLQGQTPGMTVEVLASSNIIWDRVCHQVATSPDEAFTLTRPLKPGEHVMTVGGLASTSPEETVQQRPPSVGRVAGLTHPYACASCLWLTNATPGATVEVRDSAGFLRGKAAAPDGNARLGLAPPMGHGETLVATQFVCGVPGPSLNLLASEDVPSRQSLVDSPRIVGALRRCDSAVRIEGVFDGATVTVSVDGREVSACFDRSALWFNLGFELRTGEKVNVRQAFHHCQLFSKVSSPDVVVGERTMIDPPFLRGPLCKGTRWVRVGNLVSGSEVTIEQDGLEIGGGTAWDSSCDFTIKPLIYRYHSKVSAKQALCGLVSASSNAVDVHRLTWTLPPPVVIGRLVECGAAVRVENVHPGARIDVVSRMLGVIGTAFSWSSEVDIIVAPALIAHDDISAIQTGCGQRVTSQQPPEHVISTPQPLQPPHLRRPIWNTRAIVPVDNVVPGAWVDVRLDGVHAGSAPSTRTFVDVPIPAKPRPGQVVHARQRLCNLVSDLSVEVTVLAIDDYDVHVTLGATSRVCQLTGGYDPEGLPHRNDTEGMRVIGTDLGISVDHTVDGEHRTYFFFGDTTDNDTDVGDCIFYTLDDNPEPDGPLLTCLTVTDFFDDDYGAFARLSIDGVSLPAFGVPTGAFSWGGRLYLFVATDLKDEHNPMTRAVLGSAADPADGFVNHGNVDWEGATGFDFHFINVSPWVIANDDWSGLPDNALPGHYGVLLCGSGHYRKSSPYLAYVPIEQITAPRSGWRYFTRHVADAHGNPWSTDRADAAALFDDEVIGELSFSYHPALQKWLLIYNSFDSDGSIVMRSATVPWGIWSGPSLHLTFDPYPNNLVLFRNADGLRKFIHEPGKDKLDILAPGSHDGGSIYGPYLVSRWNRWDDAAQEEHVYFTMSTWVPYQAQLMRSRLHLGKR